jgi:drug/metabolite transporter (DMT)-like permease
MTTSVGGVVLVLSANPLWSSASGRGDVLALGASVFYAAYIVITQRARMHLAAPTVFVLSLLGSIAVLLPVYLLRGTPITGYSGRRWLLLLALALVPQLGGWFTISYALGHLL